MAVLSVIRQRVPMLDAPTLEDRTRPALTDVGRVPIRGRFAERERWFALAMASSSPTVPRSRSGRPRAGRRPRVPRTAHVRPRSMIS